MAKHCLEMAMCRHESATPTDGELAQTLMYQRFADDRPSDSESDGGNQMRQRPSNSTNEMAASYISAPTDCPTNYQKSMSVGACRLVGCRPLVAAGVQSADHFISIDGYQSAGGSYGIQSCATEPRDAATEPLSKRFGRNMGRVIRVSDARGLCFWWGGSAGSGRPTSKHFRYFPISNRFFTFNQLASLSRREMTTSVAACL
jgi:hypothetical protein